ncbi:hypothetical protein SAMN05428950_101891 [Sphingomonas sp. OV641]|uniref:hypothetical protein n=1 Tax=Sphingomonas sp. OV641 TaxID=1881068 RepID=UPI0008CD06E4|nr:hypothetical protein [Sphingomonas sp. OV641]SEJ02714.1 hypothetical protein SAMN05428950_101891 [Sphingomonas sp. OV641]
MMANVADQSTAVDEAFGTWLVKQDGRGGLIGNLATALKADRTFPRAADPEGVRKFMGDRRAGGDDWEALEDAELEWRCY